MDSALWHYNMGTVQAELNNWPLARYHLLLAKEAGHQSPQQEQNQKFVEEKLDIGRLEKPLGFSDYLIKGSLIATEGIFMTFALLAVVLGIWTVKKKPSRGNIAFLLVGTLLPVGLNFWIKSWPKQIVVQPVEIFEGPSALFGQRGEIPPGVMVITDTKGEWKKIVYPSRFTGWIKENGLKKLEL